MDFDVKLNEENITNNIPNVFYALRFCDIIFFLEIIRRVTLNDDKTFSKQQAN